MEEPGIERVAKRKPPWLRRRLPRGPEFERVRAVLRKARLHTVCEEAMCPNLWECFSNHTATFLILGDTCTRNCGFCAVKHGRPGSPDSTETGRLVDTADQLGLRHVVVTSVTRDDLPDGGAGQFADTVREVHARLSGTAVELLVPDFHGHREDLARVLDAGPEVLNHNLETVERLYAVVRPGAEYNRSLTLLERAGGMAPDTPTKSGMMLGLGERPDEVRRALQHLLDAGCRMLTLGQYLQPSRKHLEVRRYVPPEEFDEWRREALAMGFSGVESGPFVRSSYRAGELYRNLKAGVPAGASIPGNKEERQGPAAELNLDLSFGK